MTGNKQSSILRHMQSILWKLMTALAVATTPSLALAQTLEEVLTPYGIKFDSLEKAVVSMSNSRKSSEGKVFHNIIAELDGVRLELEIVSQIDADTARAVANAQYKAVERLYGDQQTPYSGEITNLSSCPKDKRPSYEKIKVSGDSIRVLIGLASDRSIFGACDASTAKKLGAFLAWFDGNALYRFKLFRNNEATAKSKLLMTLSGLRRIEK